MDTRAAIDDFLAGHRIAFVGVSMQEDDFSRMVLKELVHHGYEVVPVRPGAAVIEGRKVYARVQDVPGALDGAFVMTPPEITKQVVHDCAEAHVPRVWMHRGAGRGAVSDEAVSFCEEHGIAVVAGQCPMMFLGEPAAVHRVHAAAKRLTGTFPGAAPAVSAAGRARVLLAHAAVGWMLCAATMAFGMRALSPGAALAVHAVAAPIWFALVSWVYFRAFGYTRPLVTAAAFLATAVVLDVVIVAVLLQAGFAMFASPLGTWIPFAAIFAATALTGVLVRNRPETCAHG